MQFGVNATEAAANPVSLTKALTQVSGNTISKISGGTAWNADVTSTVSVTGSAFASASAAQNNKTIMFGLNADPAADRSYSSIDYAWYTNSDGNVYIYESGGNAGNYGAYTASDVFTISYEGTSVVYRMNGVIKRTVATSANRTFFFDSSFNQVGGALNNVRFGASDVKFVQQPFDGSGTIQLDTSANPALIAGSDFLVNGSSVTKAAGGTAWNADATSAASLTGGAHVSAKAGQTNKGIMFGLNADPNADQSYSSIDYAWYTASGGVAYIYENGGNVGSFGAYTTNDVFTVTYEGSSVVYRINGVAKRTVSTTANRSFYLDSSFYEAGGTLNELRFGANAAAAEASPVNLVTSPVAIAGNTLSKVSGGTAWNADASSAINVTGAAFVSASAVATNKGAMFGLNADARSDHGYASLDYAWYTASDGVAYIYENGGSCGSFGAYTTNDVFSVTYEGSSVVYRKNGVVKRTVTTTADRSFYFDSSFYEVGAAIKDVHFGSGAPKGVQLAYDAAGNRRTASTLEGGYLATESYNYDANNRLVSTARAGSTTSLRSYDAAGQVIEQTTFSSPGTVSERRVSSYNSNGWVTEQNVYNGSGTRTQRTLHTGYDGVGNNTNYQVSVYTGTNYTNYYATTYAKFDSYKESKVAGTSTYFGAGATTTSYDQNGNLTAVSETFATSKNRTFVTDQSGQILQKTENGKTQNYFYANDKPLGDSGGLGGADFDYNYTPVSDQFPGNVPGSYVVSAGDTLRGIALAMFGDAQLWYLIADANGLKSDADLKVGRNLVMPNKVTNLRNAHDTFQPYQPGKIIGDTTPTLPNPPPPPAPKKKKGKKCGGVGAIVVAVVAIVATVMTAGAAAIAMGAASSSVGVMSAGMAALGGSLGAVGFGAAVIGGVVGSVVSQGVGMALGMQDKFSWSGVAMSAIGAAAGAAVGGVGSAVEKFVGSPVLGAIAQGVASSVLTQGIAVATGYQSKFSWTSVAAAAVGSGIGYGVARAASGIDNTVVRGTLSGLANGAARALVTGGRVNWGNVAADAFGNTLGSSVVDHSIATWNGSQQAAELQRAEQESTFPGLNPNAPSGQGLRAGGAGIGYAPLAEDVAGGDSSLPDASTPNTRTARTGDSWAKIAREVYGDERYALALARANGATSTNLARGATVQLPDLEGIDLKAGGRFIAADAAMRAEVKAQAAAAAAQAATVNYGNEGRSVPEAIAAASHGAVEPAAMDYSFISADGLSYAPNDYDGPAISGSGKVISGIVTGAIKTVGLGVAEPFLQVADVVNAGRNAVTGSNYPMYSMLGQAAENGASTPELLWETAKNVASMNPLVGGTRSAYHGTEALLNEDWEGVGGGLVGLQGSFAAAKAMRYDRVAIEFDGVGLQGSRLYQGGAIGSPRLVDLDSFGIRHNASIFKQYVSEMEAFSGFKLGTEQRTLLKEFLRSEDNGLVKLSTSEAKAHRWSDSTRDALINEWEQNTGQQWPTYGADKLSKRGEPYIRKGEYFDAHEIIPNQFNAPHKWWNIVPAERPNAHQAGIHGAGSGYGKIVKRFGG